MKKTFKSFLLIALLAAIAFSVAACGDGNNDDDSGAEGTLTVTDIPAEYNGKYIRFLVGDIIRGAETISKGKAVIPLTVLNTGGKRYTGNDTFVFNWSYGDDYPAREGEWWHICLWLYETAEFNTPDFICQWAFPTITFKNGSTKKSWNDGCEPYLATGIAHGGSK